MSDSVKNSVNDRVSVPDRSRPGLVRELADVLLQNKKWWLGPIVVFLVLVGGLLLVGGSAAAPFVYTIF